MNCIDPIEEGFGIQMSIHAFRKTHSIVMTDDLLDHGIIDPCFR